MGRMEGKVAVVTGAARGIGLASAELLARGVEVGEPFHFGPEGKQTGLAPNRGKYETFLSFEDPDGNGWTVQEVGKVAS